MSFKKKLEIRLIPSKIDEKAYLFIKVEQSAFDGIKVRVVIADSLNLELEFKLQSNKTHCVAYKELDEWEYRILFYYNKHNKPIFIEPIDEREIISLLEK